MAHILNPQPSGPNSAEDPTNNVWYTSSSINWWRCDGSTFLPRCRWPSCIFSFRLSGRVTPEQLCSYMQLFRSSQGTLESHCGVLQLGLATAQTLRHPGLPRWDACLAFERLLLQVCALLTCISHVLGGRVFKKRGSNHITVGTWSIMSLVQWWILIHMTRILAQNIQTKQC